MRISADSRYRLYINGAFVAFGPSRCYPWYQCIDAHEIDSLLKPGRNVIAVLVYQPGYSYFSYVHRRQAGLLVEIMIDGESILVSNTAWKVSRDKSYSSCVPRLSIYGAGQEHRDLRQSDNWTAVDYDDNDWPSACVCADIGQPPWNELQERPAITFEQELKQVQQIEVREGNIRDLQTEDLSLGDPHEIARQGYSSSRPIQQPFSDLADDCVRLYVYDTGHSQVGWAHVEINGAQGGETVLISYLEKGQPGNWIIPDPQTYCRVRMTDKYILARGKNTLEPFTPRGGRYLLVALVGPVVSSVQFRVGFRPRRRLLVFKQSSDLHDQQLAEIAQMCRRTLQACLQDTLIDCPWREQAHWTGDGAVSGRVIAECCGQTEPLRRMLELASQGAAPDGILPGVTPSEAWAYVVPSFNFSWVEGLFNYFEITRDGSFTEFCWPTLERMLIRFSQDIAADGLIRSQPGRRFFLDWATLSTDEPNAFYNLRYLYALQLAAALAGHLDRRDNQKQWGQQADRLSKSIKRAFYHDGRWYDQINSDDQSQHVIAIGVLTGLIQGSEAKMLLDLATATSLEQTHDPLILASPYMHFYLFEALKKLKRQSDIVNIIRFRWGRWLDRGAVTTWENWDIDFPDGSACHSWSAYPLLYI